MTDLRSRRPLLVASLVAGLAVVGAALYGTLSGPGNSAAPECRAATPVAERLAPLAQGEVAAVKVEPHPRPLPALGFNDPEGRPITLATFQGKTVLLHLCAAV